MSEVNLNFVVETYDATFTVENVDLTFTPTATELGIYTGGYATAAGSSGQVQYNNGGILAGNSHLTFNSTTKILTVDSINSNATILANNLGASNTQTTLLTVYNMATLGNVANIRITGGTSTQSLKTYGNGVVYFGNTTPGGSNTQLQYNNAGELAGMANVTYTSGKLNLGPVAYVKMTGGSNNQFLKTDGNGNLSFSSTTTVPGGSNTQLQYNNNGTISGIANVTFASGNLSLGNVANVKMTGGTSGQVLSTDGTGNLSWITGGGGGNTSAGGSNTQMQYNNAGVLGGMPTFTFNNTSNLTTMSGNLDMTGTPTLHQGKEKITSSGTSGGTINFNILDYGAIVWCTTALTGNLSINVRGDASTTLASQLSNWESITIVLGTSVGTTIYVPTAFSLDGTSTTVRWVGGIAPSSTNISADYYVVYTYTITRQLLDNYLVLGSFTGYHSG